LVFAYVTLVFGIAENQLCSLCDGLSNTDCSLKVDSITSKLPSDELYKFYMSTTSSSLCDNIDQVSCLQEMSGKSLDFSFEEKMKFFTKGCEKNEENGEDSNDEITCFLCDPSSSATDCLQLLKGILASMSSDLRLSTEQMIYPTVCTDSITTDECLVELDEMISELSDSDLYEVLNSGCSNGLFGSPDDAATTTKLSKTVSAKPVVSHFYSVSDCDLCVGYSDEECSDTLMLYIKNLDSGTRLAIEETIFSGECKNIPDSYCLAYLDEMLLTLKDSDLQTLLIKSCASGIFDQSVYISNVVTSVKHNDAVVSAQSCSLCTSMTDTECLDLLSSNVKQMSDKNRLNLEKVVFGSDSCQSKTDKDCLILLDIQFYGASDEKLLAYLSDACTQGLFEQSQTETKHLTTHDSSSCSFCNNINDDECLASLSESLESTSGHIRMTVELEILDEDCSSLNDNACLKYLDSIFTSLSDAERLSALKVGCSSGLIHTSSTTSLSQMNILQSTPISQSYTSSAQFLIAVVVVIAMLAYYRRRKQNSYISIPDNNAEIEIEI
jgi:hypothetical protein